MIYRFGPYELDIAKVELRATGTTRYLEPQVFALLALLVQNHDRLVSKEEIIEKVWDGRIVSDAAIASRVKSARRAVGDDGKLQASIRTIHRQGFRFVANVRTCGGTEVASIAGAGSLAAAVSDGPSGEYPDQSSRPSLAVLPFRLIGDDGQYAALAIALPAELISELSRLRWLFVTARGSSFRLRASDTEVSDMGRLLGVRYCLSGTIELSNRRLAVAVELVDTSHGGIVWAERFSGLIDDVHAMRAHIRTAVLTALEIQVPIYEAALARLRAIDNLDAWAAYHLALQHMYRFNRLDNATARSLFQRAVALDPLFARAHAGLSFIHFQTAFMRYTDDIVGETGLARRCAERGLELDSLDPFVNFTMGRTFWLDGDLESSLNWLRRSTNISPHYAQGIYALAWTEALSARPEEGRMHANLAMRLSPLDPLHYAMLATRAFTHMAVGEDAEAAHWAEQAARSHGAHVLIAMIAGVAHTLNGDSVRAALWARTVRERNAAMNRDHFCRAFPMKSDTMHSRVLGALASLGF